MGRKKGNKGSKSVSQAEKTQIIGKSKDNISRKGYSVNKSAMKASEIDDLFSDLKEIKEAKKMEEERLKEELKMEKDDESSDNEDYGPPLVPHTGKWSSDKTVSSGLIRLANGDLIPSPEAPLERIQDGVAVYKAHLLKVGGGGGTALCPFDCACCF